MEDWHVGDSKRVGFLQDVPRHEVLAMDGVANFKMLACDPVRGFANHRGTVSRQCHFEARVPGLRALPPHGESAQALRSLFISMLSQVAISLPIEALIGSSDDAVLTRELLIPSLIPAFSSSRSLKSLPSRFHLQLAPQWLTIDPPSGELMINKSLSPISSGSKQPLTVQLLTSTGLTVEPEEVETMKCCIVGVDSRRMLSKLTLTAANGVAESQPAQLKSALQNRLAPVYDFEGGAPREVCLGIWVHAMAEAALLSTAFANCHLFSQQ